MDDQRRTRRHAVGDHLDPGGPLQVHDRGKGGEQIELAGLAAIGTVKHGAVGVDQQQIETRLGRLGATPEGKHHWDGSADPVVEPIGLEQVLRDAGGLSDGAWDSGHCVRSIGGYRQQRANDGDAADGGEALASSLKRLMGHRLAPGGGDSTAYHCGSWRDP